MAKVLLKSFKYAFRGIRYLFGERNFRIHTIIAALVIFFGFIFQIDKYEWITILILIAFVLASEGINSSIERICDLIASGYSERIKKIKDISAAAVLICAIVSAIIGIMIFWPYIITIANG